VKGLADVPVFLVRPFGKLDKVDKRTNDDYSSAGIAANFC
jgi:hypothetical protein